MIQKHILFKPGFVFIFLFFFLSSACANRQAVRPPEKEKETFALQTSMKVAEDGKITVEKKPANGVKPAPETGFSPGRCVYGCAGASGQEKKKDEKTALLPGQAAPAPSPGSPPMAHGAAEAGVPRDYVLGPEDIIDVSVWKNESLSRTVSIRPDGKISLPLVGDIQAAGLTTSLVRDSIKEKLKDYIGTPEVSIIVKEINSMVVFVTGEVSHPGKLMLRSDTSVLQAVILAGGFTQFASPNKIVLLRRVGGIETRKQIRYKDIVSGKRPEEDILLQRGDTIIVP
ncbi:MAG: polysaccharide biosynthesis/export family protein [Nitrospiria bacterium]